VPDVFDPFALPEPPLAVTPPPLRPRRRRPDVLTPPGQAPDDAPSSFDPFSVTPAHDGSTEPPEPGDDLPPDEPGFFSKWLLEPLGRPGSALKGLLAGEFGHAAKSLVGSMTPFAGSLGLYDPKEDYTSGQHLLKNWGLLDREDNPLFSGGGAAGLVTDLALDPLNLIGVGEAKGALKAAQVGGEVLHDLSAAEKAAKVAETAGQAGNASRNMLEFGRHYDPFALLKLGGKYNPINYLPQVPALTAPLELPEAIAGKTLIEGKPVMEGLGKAAEFVGGLPPVQMAGQLFSKVPPEIKGVAREFFKTSLDKYGNEVGAGQARALDEAGRLQQALKNPDLLNPAEVEARAVQHGPDLVDPLTGEVASEGTPGLEQEFGLSPEKDAYNQMPFSRYEPPKAAAELPPEGARIRGLDEYALRSETEPGRMVEGSRGRGRVVSIDQGLAKVRYRGGVMVDEPVGDLKPIFSRQEEEAKNLLGEFGPEGAKQIEKRAFDTRKALGQGLGLESVVREEHQLTMPGAGLTKEANIALQHKLDNQVGKLGYTPDKAGQAKALPKAIEQVLGAGFPLPPGLKSVETFSADAAELVPGDHFPLAGETFTVKGNTPEGKLRLKDHVEIEVPPEFVPKDKGAQIERAGQRMLEQESERILGNAENRQLPPEIQQHLDALKQEVQEAGRPAPSFDPFKLPEAEPPAPAAAARELTVYHGTDRLFSGPVKPGGAGDVIGAHFTEDPDVAREWAGWNNPDTKLPRGERGRVIEGRVTLQNPASEKDVLAAKKYLGQGWTRESLTEELKRRGFDGIIDDTYKGNQVIVFNPDQVRYPSLPETPEPKLPPDIIPQVEAEAAGRAEKGSASAEQYQRLQRLKANEKTLAATIGEMERNGTPVNSPQFQAAMRQRQDLSVERFGLENEIRTGQPSPIGPRPTPAAVERETFKRQYEPAFKQQAAIQQYLVNAGYGTSEAARDAKQLSQDVSPEVHQIIGDHLELGQGPAVQAVEVAKALRQTYDDMFEAEQAFAVPTPGLKDPRLVGYAPHIPTKQGAGFFKAMAKAPEQRAQFFKNLMEARAQKGVANLAEGGMAEGLEQGAKNIFERSAGDKQIAIANYQRGEAEARLAMLDPETRQWLQDHGLEREFLTWDKVAQTTHESQIPRLTQYKGLTINELNDVAKASGAKGDVFSADPAVQLFVRQKRHEVAKAANTLFERLAEGLGSEVPAHINPVSTADPAIIRYQDQGFGIAEINQKLVEQGRNPIVFPDMATAQGVQKTLAKMLTPEELHPALEWYDKLSRSFKAWVTKGFPAFHIRNHFENRLQSFLEDVPVSGEHYTMANRFMAGKDFEVPLGEAGSIGRDALKQEMLDQGVIDKGYFESEFGHALEGRLKGEEPTWNPLDPNNKIIAAGERFGAGLAMLPGQLASGAGAATAMKADGSALETLDRVGHYIAKRMQGLNAEAAGQSVKKALFDYGDLNDFEKNVLGRAVFFYSYQRHVLPFVLNKLIERPGAIHQMLELSAGGQGPDQGGLPKHLPNFVREGLPSSMGQDAEGNPEVLWGVDNPVLGALGPVAGFSEGAQRGGEKLLGSLNPLLRTPLEYLTGRRFEYGQGIEESNKPPHYLEALPEGAQDMLGVSRTTSKTGGTRYSMDPYALFALESSPLSRVSSTLSKLTDPKKGLGDKALNLLTGAHVTSIDEEKQDYYAKKDAALARIKELERKGLVSERQIPIFSASDVGKADPAVQAALKATRAKAKKQPAQR
jgi:hypothetical protein